MLQTYSKHGALSGAKHVADITRANMLQAKCFDKSNCTVDITHFSKANMLLTRSFLESKHGADITLDMIVLCFTDKTLITHLQRRD